MTMWSIRGWQSVFITLCAQSAIVWNLTDWVGSTIVFHLRSFSLCGAAESSLLSLRMRKHCSHLVFLTLVPFSVTAKLACIVEYFLKKIAYYYSACTIYTVLVPSRRNDCAYKTNGNISFKESWRKLISFALRFLTLVPKNFLCLCV